MIRVHPTHEPSFFPAAISLDESHKKVFDSHFCDYQITPLKNCGRKECDARHSCCKPMHPGSFRIRPFSIPGLKQSFLTVALPATTNSLVVDQSLKKALILTAFKFLNSASS